MTINIKTLRPVGNLIQTQTSSNYNILDSAIFYQSGTAALAAAIIAASRLKPSIKHPEVLVPAYSCPDLISAINYAGAVPVLVDLEVDSAYISCSEISSSINKNTIAIVAIRFLGLDERSSKLSNIAKQNNLIYIEDSAQGFPNKNVGSYWHGDIVILSFGRGKPINLLGGGAVLTNKTQIREHLPLPPQCDDTLTIKLKLKLKLLIYNVSINPITYGLISRIPGLNIGETIYKPLLEIKGLGKYTKSLLDSNIREYNKRASIQVLYSQMLQNNHNDLCVDLPKSLNHDMEKPLLRYPILVKNTQRRNKFYSDFKDCGISLMYKKPLDKIDKIEGIISPSDNTFPNASDFSQQLLTLPTHEGVNSKILKKIEHGLKAI